MIHEKVSQCNATTKRIEIIRILHIIIPFLIKLASFSVAGHNLPAHHVRLIFSHPSLLKEGEGNYCNYGGEALHPPSVPLGTVQTVS